MLERVCRILTIVFLVTTSFLAGLYIGNISA